MVRRSTIGVALGAVAVIGMGVLAVVTPSASASGQDSQPCLSSQDCRSSYTLAEGATLPYYASWPLSGTSTATSAVVVVHGTNRDANGYFDHMVAAAKDANATASTEIVAPDFQTSDDHPASSDAVWTNGGTTTWKDGDDSVSPAGISSFTVMDEILNRLANKQAFPKLTSITLVGHSAGGQFVQRYAAAGQAPSHLSGLSFHVVSANPSSYLYFGKDRPDATCSGYNDYKYGLDNLNRYLGAQGDQQLIDQYTHRQVTYLLGGDDTKQDNGIDTSCMANAQGPYRLARGQNYYSYIHKNYPSAPHDMVVVPGVGHDAAAMFDSPKGRAAIFGSATPPTSPTTTTTSPGGSTVNDYVTFYGYTDNNPPGTAITHSCIHQSGAGGTGTYQDPVTYAQGDTNGPWCQIIYVPFLKKYFIHEDSECGDSCTGDSAHHVDLWMGGDSDSTSDPEQSALINCEDQWTQNSTSVVLDPPSNEPVDKTPMFTPPTTCHGGQGD